MKLYNRKERDAAPIAQPDPYILKDCHGKYYVYASGGHVFSSDRLLGGWRYCGICLDMPDQKNCWAPCVMEADGKYYMYYSSMDVDADNPHEQSLRLAVADRPEGPFRFLRNIFPPFSIDPHVVRNASGLYVFYSANDAQAQRPGTYIRCDQLLDPMTPANHPADIVRPTMDEEIFKRNRFEDGRDWHTLEGAFYFHVGTTHFLMYSGACYLDSSYFIGYCVAHGGPEEDLRRLKWEKYPDPRTFYPIFRKNPYAEGMGHNSVLFDGDRWYIVYHARDRRKAVSPVDTRTARIDELHIQGDRLSAEVTA